MSQSAPDRIKAERGPNEAETEVVVTVHPGPPDASEETETVKVYVEAPRLRRAPRWRGKALSR